MDQDLISIIVPIYNVQSYLPECLDSIINQSYKNIEIILVSDCSTDKSLDIEKKYAKLDKRIVIIDNKKNLGLSGSRNEGIKISCGKYIVFVDSDDYVENTYIKDLYKHLINTNTDLCVCQATLLNDKNGFFDNEDRFFMMFDLAEDDYFKKVINVENLLTEVFLHYPRPMAWGKIYRADIIKNNNLQFPPNLKNEDELFFVKYILKIKSLSILYKPLYIYRVNRADSIMAKMVPIDQNIKICELIFNEINNHKDALKYKNFLFFYYNLFVYKMLEDYRKKSVISIKTYKKILTIFKEISENLGYYSYPYSKINLINRYIKYSPIFCYIKNIFSLYIRKILNFSLLKDRGESIFTKDWLHYDWNMLYKFSKVIVTLPKKIILNIYYTIKYLK